MTVTRCFVIAGAMLVCVAACSPAQKSPAGVGPATNGQLVNMASAETRPPIALVPDEEATEIPSFGGVPLVPIEDEAANLSPNGAAPAPGQLDLPEAFDTNTQGVTIIKEAETLQLKAYELGGLSLIGYGHLMLEGEKDPITEPTANTLLVTDLAWCEQALERYISVPLTHNEFSAVSAFCYNVGSAKTRTSSIVKRLNAGDRAGAANAFLLWNRMNGKVMKALADRRARERSLFLTP